MKRTIIHTKSGEKEYAVRKTNGRFSDIQSIKRSKQLDLKHTAKGEKLARILRAVDKYFIDWKRKDLIVKIKEVLK